MRPVRPQYSTDTAPLSSIVNRISELPAHRRGGLIKDEREAARFYRLAADQGNAAAQNNLGWYYDQGLGGLTKDEREAARFYRLAADQGWAAAQYYLGVYYDLGLGGLTKDEREASTASPLTKATTPRRTTSAPTTNRALVG